MRSLIKTRFPTLIELHSPHSAHPYRTRELILPIN